MRGYRPPVANPWLARRVLNYAHQGGAREGPSSTLHAMRRAVTEGAHAIELDVHATADGQLVVCHDATVDRTTNGSGRIAGLTWDEIRRLDNAHWWIPDKVVDHEAEEAAYVLRGSDDPDLGIPRLEDVLEAFPDIFLNFDIKQTKPDVEPYEEALARALRDHGRTDDVIVASFSDQAIEAFHQAAPEIATAAATQATAAIYFAILQGEKPPDTFHRALQVPPAFGGVEVVTRQFVEGAHQAGLAVHVWTIDEEEEMSELIAKGVDGVMTDRPSILTRVLTSQG